MNWFYRVSLFLFFLIFLIFQQGCKKNPVAFDDEFYNDDFFIQPGTFPSYETYFMQMNYDFNSPLPDKYLINYNLKVTHQVGTTCVAHATAHALSINYQHRLSFFPDIQFDPNFVIDTAAIIGINSKNFQEKFTSANVIRFMTNYYNSFSFDINDIKVNGCDVMWNYVKPDPISYKIANNFFKTSGSSSVGSVYEIFNDKYDKTLQAVKIALINNNALLYLAPSSSGFTDGYVKTGTLEDSPSSHAITLIGWDDNFDFGRNEKGGFIFLNSYGEDWPRGTNNNGVGYISYAFLKNLSEDPDLKDLKISTATFLIPTLRPVNESDFLTSLDSFFLKINEKTRNPFVENEVFSIDRAQDLSISFYQAQQSDAVLKFIDSATNEVIHEMTIDKNNIRCLRRWETTQKKEYANTNIISSSLFGNKDEIILEYYIKGELKDKLKDRVLLNFYGNLPEYTFTKINGIPIENFNGRPPVISQGETIEVSYYQPFDETVKLWFGTHFISTTNKKGEHSIRFSLPIYNENSNYIKTTLGPGFTLNVNGNQKESLKVKGDYEFYDVREGSSNYPEDFSVFITMNRLNQFGEITTIVPGTINDILVYFNGIEPIIGAGALWFILEETDRGGEVLLCYDESHNVYIIGGIGFEISPIDLFMTSEEDTTGALIYFQSEERKILLLTHFSECMIIM